VIVPRLYDAIEKKIGVRVEHGLRRANQLGSHHLAHALVEQLAVLVKNERI